MQYARLHTGVVYFPEQWTVSIQLLLLLVPRVVRTRARSEVLWRLLSGGSAGDGPDHASEAAAETHVDVMRDPDLFIDDGGSDDDVPAASVGQLGGHSATELTLDVGAPLHSRPRFRAWPNALVPLRQLTPVFNRWMPKDPPTNSNTNCNANNSPVPLSPPQPPRASVATRAHTPPSENSGSRDLSPVTPCDVM